MSRFVGEKVGSRDGRTVAPGRVGEDVVGNLLGAPVGLDVGADEVGRDVGCPEG